MKNFALMILTQKTNTKPLMGGEDTQLHPLSRIRMHRSIYSSKNTFGAKLKFVSNQRNMFSNQGIGGGAYPQGPGIGGGVQPEIGIGGGARPEGYSPYDGGSGIGGGARPEGYSPYDGGSGIGGGVRPEDPTPIGGGATPDPYYPQGGGIGSGARPDYPGIGGGATIGGGPYFPPAYPGHGPRFYESVLHDSFGGPRGCC
ncbi:unnamed protein product [Cylicocyclus nassatus]|uniref:Uncharacterized protein n=1 Tax=Cylicocyclus nassatus TaxID=53992 RepID=A0AA36GV04_CYLNA|nr:unnamed protein product [Cylicocyclus nassatus]